MKYFKLNSITKDKFKKINEEDVMFITHPGRMGDEDGSTFIIKKDNMFIAYRISGWMYNKNVEIKYEEALKHFPKWNEAVSQGEKYTGKYKYYYMGFGNNLCVDRSISDIFEKHLDYCINKRAKIEDIDPDEYRMSLIYNTWDEAAYETAKELGYSIEYTDEETLL